MVIAVESCGQGECRWMYLLNEIKYSVKAWALFKLHNEATLDAIIYIGKHYEFLPFYRLEKRRNVFFGKRFRFGFGGMYDDLN